eukprot:s2169_g6.t1
MQVVSVDLFWQPDNLSPISLYCSKPWVRGISSKSQDLDVAAQEVARRSSWFHTPPAVVPKDVPMIEVEDRISQRVITRCPSRPRTAQPALVVMAQAVRPHTADGQATSSRQEDGSPSYEDSCEDGRQDRHADEDCRMWVDFAWRRAQEHPEIEAVETVQDLPTTVVQVEGGEDDLEDTDDTEDMRLNTFVSSLVVHCSALGMCHETPSKDRFDEELPYNPLQRVLNPGLFSHALEQRHAAVADFAATELEAEGSNAEVYVADK